VVRYGGVTCAGSTDAASPLSFAVGRVSFQPTSAGTGAPLGGAGAGGAFDEVEHAAIVHTARRSRPARIPADRNRETTSLMVAQVPLQG
jgi:hypothetical protein